MLSRFLKELDLGTIETLCDRMAFSDDRHVGTVCGEDEQVVPGEPVPHVCETAGGAE
jgi:hypothetical protein